MIARQIASEVNGNVVAKDGQRIYWVVGELDVSSLPNVEGYSPVPDPFDQP